jgi:thiamine biosynthesis lipoprotein
MLLTSRQKTPAIVLAFCFFMLLLPACGKQPAGLQLEGAQGTALWHVTISDPPPGVAEADIQAGLDKALATTGKLLATWEPDSELSRFNQYQGTDWFAVSPELAKLVALSLQLSRQSGGAYDVTVGPLLKLWGFASHDAVKDRVPGQAEIDAARAKVGYQKLQVQLDPPALRKSQPDVQVELASVADGFAADQAGLYLESLGIRHYMVEVAGEVRARGLSLRGDAWRIAIEKPVEDGRAIQQGIHLQDAGLATSGDYRNFFVQGGKRYSHTLDPATGRPVTHNLASVSVLADSATLADAYATLLMALGEEQAKVFIEQHSLKAYLIWRNDQGFETSVTSGFQQAIMID